MSVNAWVTICKNVIKDLRNNDAYVDAYVDYNMFLKYSGTRCKKLLVWVPKLSGNVEQDACICFYHLSILPLDIPHEYVQYNQKIMIYPLNITTLMVFEENKGQGNYYPLEIYENKRWPAYLSANVQIFTIVVPQGYGEASNLEIILDPMVQDLELIRYVGLLLNIFFVKKIFVFTLFIYHEKLYEERILLKGGQNLHKVFL